MTAHEAFNEELTKAARKLLEARSAVERYQAKYQDDQTGQRRPDWGYAGSLKAFNAAIDHAVTLIGGAA